MNLDFTKAACHQLYAKGAGASYLYNSALHRHGLEPHIFYSHHSELPTVYLEHTRALVQLTQQQHNAKPAMPLSALLS